MASRPNPLPPVTPVLLSRAVPSTETELPPASRSVMSRVLSAASPAQTLTAPHWPAGQHPVHTPFRSSVGIRKVLLGRGRAVYGLGEHTPKREPSGGSPVSSSENPGGRVRAAGRRAGACCHLPDDIATGSPRARRPAEEKEGMKSSDVLPPDRGKAALLVGEQVQSGQGEVWPGASLET